MNEEYKRDFVKWLESLDEKTKANIIVNCITYLGYIGEISFGEIGSSPWWSDTGVKLIDLTDE
jgi:hypothetical protein